MISIYCGKVEDLLSNFRSDFFDACLCDPPYGLKFMGKSWDHGVPSAEIWKLVKRTLKPGAPILAFGGTRTYHRLACAIEDAGFEIFDSILGAAWIYGQGFPKSLDIGKAIDKAAGVERLVIGRRTYGDGHIQNSTQTIGFHGCDPDADKRLVTVPSTEAAQAWNGYGTALKPAWEPVVFARKPLSGTYAENCIEHGCGGLNINGSRIGSDTTRGDRYHGKPPGGSHSMQIAGPREKTWQVPAGRYPANLILSHHPECEDAGDCHPECLVAALDKQSGITRSTASGYNFEPSVTANPSRVTRNIKSGVHFGDSGGASRFFYCSKVSTRERNAGLPANLRCDHPTLKPIDLCRYLATLILPPSRGNHHRNLLIPFAGAGSEIIGAAIAGWETISAIEKEDSYVEQAWYRVKASTGIEPVIFD